MIKIKKALSNKGSKGLSCQYEVLDDILTICFEPKRKKNTHSIGDYPINIGINKDYELNSLAILISPRFWTVKDIHFPKNAFKEKVIIDFYDEEELDPEIFTNPSFSVLYIKFDETTESDIQYYPVNDYCTLEINKNKYLTGVWIKGLDEQRCFLWGENKKLWSKFTNKMIFKDLIMGSDWESIQSYIVAEEKINDIQGMEELYMNLKHQSYFLESDSLIDVIWEIDSNGLNQIKRKSMLYTWDTDLDSILLRYIIPKEMIEVSKEKMIAQVLFHLAYKGVFLNEILSKEAGHYI